MKDKGLRKDIPEKPFSVIGKIDFEHNLLIPSCIMCERTLGNESYITGVWVWEEFKRNYRYYLCEPCFQKYSTDEVEQKIAFTLASRKRLKAKLREK